MWRKPGLVLALTLWCGAAWAHGSGGPDSLLWDGVLHVLASPVSLAALVGLAAALAPSSERLAYGSSWVAALAASVAGSQFGWLPAWVAPALLVLVGTCAAAGWRPAAAVAWLLALLAGSAAGRAAALDNPGWPALAGLGVCTLVLVYALLSLLQLAQRRTGLAPLLPVARRVLGAWVTAMGLLLLTLALHQPGSAG